MYRLWFEWDFGQDDIVFTSLDKAKNWVNTHPHILEMWEQDLEEDHFCEKTNPFDYYQDEGLCDTEQLLVI